MTYLRVISIFLRCRLRHPASIFALLFTPCLFAVMSHFFPEQTVFYAYPAIALSIWGTFLIPQNIIALREDGVFDRLRITTLRSRTIISALLIVDLLVLLCSIVGTLALGWFVFNAPPQGALPPIIGGVLLALLAFQSLGILLSSIFPNNKTANIAGNLLMIVLMLTSGVITLPKQYAQYSPTWQTTSMLTGLWEGAALQEVAVSFYILLAIAITAAALAFKKFRW
ncbi:ABC transporter permease [Corynebacterium freiburgense]|uniref:ABC transporter permease n=1 Tax=Corynebacterium freiburgense TaxID=556548 RepID=UPI0003FDC7F0|nr:ABC transporter permease [Corynebacterium freiburgense]WJZ01777.1 ABC-2 type transporter [Corynebacterium freiburgense]